LTGLILGLFAFGVALSVYSALVRMRRAGTPASSRLSVLALLLVVLAVILSYCSLLGSGDRLSDGVVAAMVALSLTLAFVAANTAIETDSPTQSIVLFLHAQGDAGADEGMIESFIRRRPFRDSRLSGLIKDGVVEREEGRLVCRPSGRAVLRGLDAYRRLIGRKEVVTG
jgi:hypothetical protein